MRALLVGVVAGLLARLVALGRRRVGLRRTLALGLLGSGIAGAVTRLVARWSGQRAGPSAAGLRDGRSGAAPRPAPSPPAPPAAAPARPPRPPQDAPRRRTVPERFAALIVRARVVIVVGWVAIAVAVTLALPSIREAQVGALGDLVPAGAEAIETEQRSAELFRFPLLSRTVVVVRNDDGLRVDNQALIARRLVALNGGELPMLRGTRGYAFSNAFGVAPLVRERSTTTLIPLLFPPEVGQNGRIQAARLFANRYVAPAAPDAFVGVTGAIAARGEQADIIADKLPLVELATLVFVLGAVALYFRAFLAPIVNLVAVALAYLIAIRVVAALGQLIGVSVPSEVQPVVVALLFGVVTDYSLFFLSRFRRRLAEGDAPAEAARRTTAELTPIILTCGLTVAAASAALVVAEVGFLQAFGPGMAMSILVALAVSMTFIPATLALLGQRLFWPRAPSPASGGERGGRRRGIAHRVVATAVRAPRRTIAGCLLALAAMGAGATGIELGNPLVRGLPPENDARVAYAHASRGFVPGVLSPTVLVVERPGITFQRAELARLQRLLDAQPGVAEVVGPASNPTGVPLGVVLARNGSAARYVIVLHADPLGAAAIRRLGVLHDRIDELLARAGLPQAQASFAGDTALSRETIDNTVGDLWRVVPAVLLAVLLVLVAFLRGLVAPLYLVAAAALAPLAALGLAVALFEGILGQGELTYYVPVAAGVLLVALGSDYNIFLVGRVWHEAQRQPLDQAVVTAGAGAARAISAAGIVLAMSFGAMALVPISAFRELAFIMAAGLLIDAFLVRTVLVPAVISLVGYRSGWPGHKLRRAGEPLTSSGGEAPSP
ncbi:MAG TPA: MMPL family transporter [Solirubrobacteraceae bacterium]|nr:MMPL family transporter [Solirubrobacteraceae bacterium]